MINSGRGGQYTLTYPALGAAEKSLPPSKIAIQGRKLTARYRSGAAFSSELNDDGTMVFHFTALPDDVKTIRFDLPLSLALNRGGQFAIDGHAAAPFPATATPDAFLFKGEARRLVITPVWGEPFAIDIEHGWQQVQDNRVWNMKTFAWMASAELPRTNGNEAFYTIRIAPPGEPAVKALAANVPANAAPAGSPGFAVRLGDEDISIVAGTAGTFSLKYPALVIDGDKRVDPARIAKDASGVTLIYAEGGKGRVRLEKSSLQVAFANLPAAIKQFRMEMLIPISFAAGGTYAIGGAAPGVPRREACPAFSFSGNCRPLRDRAPDGTRSPCDHTCLLLSAASGQSRMELERLRLVVRQPLARG